MAGFQQAANALTGAYGTVAGRVGIYSELVGKNKELIEELGSKNEELKKKNEELTKKNKEITKHKELINIQKESLSIGDELLERYMSDRRNMYIRNMEHERAQKSKRNMLKMLYGKPTEEEVAPEEIPFFKKEDKGGR